MKLSYIRDMAHNYMVPELGEMVDRDDYRVHMLTENRISGLLPCRVKMRDGKAGFYYDITSRQSLEHIYGRGGMGESEIMSLLKGLHHTLREIKKYLLDPAMIVLAPEMIYMDIETKEPMFCYLPGYHKEITDSFQELSSYILEHINQTDERAVLMGYDIYRKAREENYSLEKILKVPGEEKQLSQEMAVPGKTSVFEVKKTDWTAAANVEHVQEEVFWPRQSLKEAVMEEAAHMEQGKILHDKTRKKEKESKDKKKKQSAGGFLVVCVMFSAVLFVAAAILWGLDTIQIGGIIVFLASVLIYGSSVERKRGKKKTTEKENSLSFIKEQPYINPDLSEQTVGPKRKKQEEKSGGRRLFGNTGALPPQENLNTGLVLVSMSIDRQEKVHLTKDQYVVGKLASQADIVLDHNSISRIHAKIQKEQGEYYLYDLNSTNGTFHNGRRLEVRERVALKGGDEIAFARVGFYVVMGDC